MKVSTYIIKVTAIDQEHIQGWYPKLIADYRLVVILVPGHKVEVGSTIEITGTMVSEEGIAERINSTPSQIKTLDLSLEELWEY